MVTFPQVVLFLKQVLALIAILPWFLLLMIGVLLCTICGFCERCIYNKEEAEWTRYTLIVPMLHLFGNVADGIFSFCRCRQCD